MIHAPQPAADVIDQVVEVADAQTLQRVINLATARLVTFVY